MLSETLAVSHALAYPYLHNENKIQHIGFFLFHIFLFLPTSANQKKIRASEFKASILKYQSNQRNIELSFIARQMIRRNASIVSFSYSSTKFLTATVYSSIIILRSSSLLPQKFRIQKMFLLKKNVYLFQYRCHV